MSALKEDKEVSERNVHLHNMTLEIPARFYLVWRVGHGYSVIAVDLANVRFDLFRYQHHEFIASCIEYCTVVFSGPKPRFF